MCGFGSEGGGAGVLPQVGVHGEAAVGELGREAQGLLAGLGGAQGCEQRQQVLLGGVGAGPVGGDAAVVDEGRAVVPGQGLAQPVGKGRGLGHGLAVAAPGEPVEVVGDGAGGEDQHTFIAQRTQGGADAAVPVGAIKGFSLVKHTTARLQLF